MKPSRSPTVSGFGAKFVDIQSPINSRIEYFNYESFFSIVLFALVDADYDLQFSFLSMLVAKAEYLTEVFLKIVRYIKKIVSGNMMIYPRQSLCREKINKVRLLFLPTKYLH